MSSLHPDIETWLYDAGGYPCGNVNLGRENGELWYLPYFKPVPLVLHCFGDGRVPTALIEIARQMRVAGASIPPLPETRDRPVIRATLRFIGDHSSIDDASVAFLSPRMIAELTLSPIAVPHFDPERVSRIET